MAKLSLFFGLLMAISIFSSSAIATQPTSASQCIVLTQDESRFVDLVNKERTQRGLSRLTVDPMLIEVARAHSREMSDKHYFAHKSPTPGLTTPLDRYLAAEKHKPSWALVGENLFYCSKPGVDRGHCALMNSPGHRANILESRYEQIGVGIYTSPKGEFYVTQMFLAKTD
jgi:uncharacterized protein YkwD